MDFCPIVPTLMLEKYLSKRRTWFALAQIGDPEYLKFYRRRPEDVTLILDNGAYEGAMDLQRYIEAIMYYRPTVAVLPDIYCGNAERSMHLGLGFLEAYQLGMHDFEPEWMFVPQGQPEKVDECVNIAAQALNDDRITWVGIPRCLATHIDPDPLARIALARSLKTKKPHLKVHALGMVNGNVHELYYLQKEGVRSCDSSAPVWRGLMCKKLSDPWPEIEMDFNVKEARKLPDWADYNIEEIDRCLSTP